MGQGRVKAIGFTRKESRRAIAHQNRKKRKLEEKKKGIHTVRIPRTIDNSRQLDQSFIHDLNEEEMLKEDQLDEFHTLLKGTRKPRVMITTTLGAGSYSIKFGHELATVFPHSMFRMRRGFALHTILRQLKRKDFTALIIIEQGGKCIRPDGLWIIGLPGGPTAHFRMSSVRYRREVPMHGSPTRHHPELDMHGFTTRLGHRMSRFFQSLFPRKPNLHGRQIITFHNQRDWIFFRRYRFTIDNPTTPRLQELGPRFSMYMRSLQEGCFEKGKNFEFIPKPGMWKEKLKFYL